MPEFGPYETPEALLRDQLWRCWLGVEYQIRQGDLVPANHPAVKGREQLFEAANEAAA